MKILNEKYAASRETLIKELSLSDFKLGDPSAERPIQVSKWLHKLTTRYSDVL